jgi:hypothetical protein
MNQQHFLKRRKGSIKKSFKNQQTHTEKDHFWNRVACFDGKIISFFFLHHSKIKSFFSSVIQK